MTEHPIDTDRAEAALDSLQRWIEGQIAKGLAPADLVAVLNAAMAYTLVRAGHTSIRNIAPTLSDHLIRAHERQLQSKPK